MNKANYKANSEKGGYVLSVILVIMVVFSFTCANLVNYAYVNNVEVSTKSNNLQTFWATESAMTLAIRSIELDPTFRASPNSIGGSVGNADFKLSVTKNFNNYTINTFSAGGDSTQQASTTISTRPAGWHPAFSNYVAFVDNGFVTLATNTQVKGIVYDNNLVSADTMPALDVTLSSVQIKQDLSYVTQYEKVYTDDDDDEWYYREVLAAPSQLDGVNEGSAINGAESITLSDNTVVGAESTVKSLDTLVFGASTTIGTSNEFYAANSIVVGPDSTFEQGTSLISAGDIVIESGAQIYGAIYAAGSVSISSNVVVYGSVVAGSGITIGENTLLVHDPSLFAEEVPETIEGTDEHIATRHVWQN